MDVFLSYKREERDRLAPIIHSLEELKLEVWYDASLEAGQAFDQEINQQLRAAKAILVLWTEASIESTWVRGEATVGVERKILVAASLGRVSLGPPFNLQQTADLSTWDGNADHAGWLSILKRVGKLCNRGTALQDWYSLKGWKRPARFEAFAKKHPNDPLALEARKIAEALIEGADIDSEPTQDDLREARLAAARARRQAAESQAESAFLTRRLIDTLERRLPATQSRDNFTWLPVIAVIAVSLFSFILVWSLVRGMVR